MDTHGQARRRDLWFTTVRGHLDEIFNADGSGKIPQFNPPYREPIWILPALYTGAQEHIDLANKIVARYNDAPGSARIHEAGVHSGRDFNIFQSNHLANMLHRFGHLATPAARTVMEWHTRLVFRTVHGSRQSDFKFHGANDNMPMLATVGHILGGEALNDRAAIDHGVWMLNQFRRLLSRSAWASEFNSSTYSAVTLSGAAKIATGSHDPAIRKLARQIEERLWAEVILHFHPATRQQAGPQSRAYCIDMAGHTHSLQMLLWMVFGHAVSGHDPIKSYFSPDGTEVIHFEGNYFQSIAEYCEFLEPEFHVPDTLAVLMSKRTYPAILHGRSEAMGCFEGQAAGYQTTTYMEDDFSLGSVNTPMGGGEQTMSAYLTYKRRPEVTSFRDGGTAFVRYLAGNAEYGASEKSVDGAYSNERFVSGQGWLYTLQAKNTVLVLSTPNLKKLADVPTEFCRLALIFPGHFGSITRSVIGTQPIAAGAVGHSESVACASVEVGEVYIHVQPLLPTLLPRASAVRFSRSNKYEMLEMINYQGSPRAFKRQDLARMVNGCVVTVSGRKQESSLKDFHRRLSQCAVTDYISAGHRYFLYQRPEVELEVVLTMDPFGVQTEAINGRHRPVPIFESNQIDVGSLPFVGGPVAPNRPHFPWGDNMTQLPWKNWWLIGSRGLPTEAPYSAVNQGADPIDTKDL
ncbi:MAG: hypothetical protein HKL95_11795 [Phycisphaerae bacterium]|nr:hypothetical protein [Phycisphaerae bacterium]